jgi:hypothetical protein
MLQELNPWSFVSSILFARRLSVSKLKARMGKSTGLLRRSDWHGSAGSVWQDGGGATRVANGAAQSESALSVEVASNSGIRTLPQIDVFYRYCLQCV